MHFCQNCENMYYLKLGENKNQLIYYCRNCGHEDTDITHTSICVSEVYVNQTHKKITNINKYTKYDPTLPCINTIKCPNQDCISNRSENPSEREVIYNRYDDTNMKYVYLCCKCDTTWSTNEKT